MPDFPTMSVQAAVIGAGIAGASVAAELADHGPVALLEAESAPGMHTTGRSAAMFAPIYGPAMVRGLTRAETTAYVEHQLALAGCKHPVFEPAAIEAIYQATSGLPRRTNLLAHHALLAAAIGKANNVTAEHVQAALIELG